MVHDLLEEPTARLVLESRAGQDQRDRSVISRSIGSSSRTRLAYGHEVAHQEPLLWVPGCSRLGMGPRWSLETEGKRSRVGDRGQEHRGFLGARKSGRSPSGEEPDLLPWSTALGNPIVN